jgi:hypothetical protein
LLLTTGGGCPQQQIQKVNLNVLYENILRKIFAISRQVLKKEKKERVGVFLLWLLASA